MKILKKGWDLAGNIHGTMAILSFMILALLHGYAMLKHHANLFHPINDVGFLRWACTWGKESPVQTLWLFMLVGLLGLLSVNTFVCTTDRVVKIVKNRNKFQSTIKFILRFAPHIMHYSMLIMFLGYLVTYLFAGTYSGKVLLVKKSIHLDSISITLEKLVIDYYTGNRIVNMEDRAINVQAELLLESKELTKHKTLSFNNPIRFKGLTIHLKKFSPGTKGGMGLNKYITLIIKKDAGAVFYFTGMFCFVIGLFMYAFQKIEERK